MPHCPAHQTVKQLSTRDTSSHKPPYLVWPLPSIGLNHGPGSEKRHVELEGKRLHRRNSVIKLFDGFIQL